jgi:hypothetical protein
MQFNLQDEVHRWKVLEFIRILILLHDKYIGKYKDFEEEGGED